MRPVVINLEITEVCRGVPVIVPHRGPCQVSTVKSFVGCVVESSVPLSYVGSNTRCFATILGELYCLLNLLAGIRCVEFLNIA
jgi:hypothetical protein